MTDLDLSVSQIKTKIVSCPTADSKPVKQEVNGTVILLPLVFPAAATITLVEVDFFQILFLDFYVPLAVVLPKQPGQVQPLFQAPRPWTNFS